ncbi:hypothetical protein ABB37_01249 [Leptomonas pyrrhocoris]|uniref:Uncharacterized protein n=1 Tax=Leptomonas pyrrhocoris TaxID=157538 RepID=A0A0N0VH02_LEPPY|nr:hypothetical protein ABB37_01249 [Leptomonas pyrrhocoris]KPA84758.1 hypothetical protein ABB37_01249 [Leptomonas pyrrhocoris]|eukprot:XP_015663197.1 hypothetical protein ABB37_01249 [Leptomonas pyrrhocoris]
MSAAVEAKYPEEDSYGEDDFEDDFESEDTSHKNLPHDAVHASTRRKDAEELSPSSSQRSTTSSSKRSSRAETPLRAEQVALHASSAASHTSSSSFSSSTSSSDSKDSSSRSQSHLHASSHHSHANDTADPYAELEEGAAAGVAGAESKENDSAAAAVNADEVHSDGERRADGSPVEPRAKDGKKSAAEGRKQKTARAAHGRRGGNRDGHSARRAPSNNTAVKQRHIERPQVPQNIEELEAMQAENAKLRDELFEKNRDYYHTTLAQSMKGGHGMSTMTGGGTATTMTMTNNGGGAGSSITHRDVAARLVQESLMAHRTLQMLRLEQRDLTQRRDELKQLISKYKRASKYRQLVAGMKEDIVYYREEYRDVQLEVRCNEKLLLLSEHMAESGIGDRRVQEEMRAQNALTQRRREHALRDADAAQRKRDAAAQRVEELKVELQRRREAARDGGIGQSPSLLLANREKKDRIRELRAELHELESAGQGVAASGRPRYRTQQSMRDDAEREYLQKRIAEMQRSLNTTAAANTNINGKAPQADGAAATPPATEVNSTAPSTPPVVAGAKTDADEIDVSAWPNAHPVEATSAPAQTVPVLPAFSYESGLGPHEQQSSGNKDGLGMYPTDGGAGQNVHIPPVPQPPYTQEPTQDGARLPVPPAVSDETPAWLGGGVAEDDAPTGAGAANPPQRNSLLHVEEHDIGDTFDEEDVVDDEEELDEPAPAPAAAAPAATTAAAKEDDGPDWLNF